MAKIGRPTLFTDMLAAEICHRLSSGENISDICRDSHMPDKVNVWRWKREREDFRNLIASAMQDKAETCVDRIDDYKNMALRGEIEPAVAKMAIDAEKWKASKFSPRVFGEKSTVESTATNLNINKELALTEADYAILRRFGWKDEVS